MLLNFKIKAPIKQTPYQKYLLVVIIRIQCNPKMIDQSKAKMEGKQKIKNEKVLKKKLACNDLRKLILNFKTINLSIPKTVHTSNYHCYLA